MYVLLILFFFSLLSWHNKAVPLYCTKLFPNVHNASSRKTGKLGKRKAVKFSEEEGGERVHADRYRHRNLFLFPRFGVVQTFFRYFNFFFDFVVNYVTRLLWGIWSLPPTLFVERGACSFGPNKQSGQLQNYIF